MSYAPPKLKELRRYLLETTGNTEAGNFGIVGRVSPRRNSGYHLGREDIFGAGGLGSRDYSIQHPRDKAGLTDASAAIDIKLPVGELKRLAAYLVAEGKAGRANDVAEVIGPGADGRAYTWRAPTFTPVIRPKGDGHEWHIHISFRRDSESRDKVQLFRRYFYFEPTAEAPTVTPDQVKLLQSTLNAMGAKLLVDGYYGPATEAALKAAPATLAELRRQAEERAAKIAAAKAALG